MSSQELTVSWSSLKRWEACHQHDYRSKRGEAKSIKDGRIFLPGTIADRLMREWLESEDPQPGQMVENIEEMFRRYAFPETDDEREEAQYVIKWKGDKRQDQQDVKDFVRRTVTDLEPILMREVIPHDYHPELRFRTSVGLPLFGQTARVTLIGGIDIAVRLREADQATGRYRLFDLKTTVNDDYIRSTLGQGIFYDIAFGHWIGDKNQPEQFGFIAPGLPEKIYWAKVTNDDRRFMLQRIIKYAEGLMQGDNTPKESDAGCQWCDVSHVCDKWRIDSQVDAQGKNRASFGKAAARRRTRSDRTDAEATT